MEHDQNSFTITLSTLDYALKDQVEYAYSLSEKGEKWFPINTGNVVTFRNMHYGDYKIRFRARVRNQQWSDKFTSLTVSIAPPLWLSWWAKVLYALITIALIRLAFIRYKRRMEQRNEISMEKHKLEQERQLNDERLRFYTNVAHELRTPLTLILGPLEDLGSDSLSSEQKKKLTLVRKSARRLYDLVNRIMEFRKTETHNRKLNVECGDVSSLVRDVTMKYHELSNRKNVKIEFSSATHASIWYDREVVTTIMDNLLSNALKYTPNGTISVRVEQQETEGITYTCLVVKDTGYGIPQEALEKVFNRYYQAGGDHQAFGTGIGLALVKSLATLHEGNITVSSTVGKGSTFVFRLRTDNEYPNAIHVKTAQEETIPPTEKKDKEKKDLLVVEDNDDIRSYIAEAFSDSFNVITATDGKDGMDKAISQIPDVIISDIMMPVMDGIEMCERLKTDVRTSHIPIILLTAKDTDNDKTEGYEHGADSYITKPFSIKMLKSRVDNLLENRDKAAQYFTSDNYRKELAVSSVSQMDKEFMKKVFETIDKYVKDEKVNINDIASEMNMSYSTLNRKLKALAGKTANELVRKTKMRHAEQMLLSGKYNINETMMAVGYNSRTAFRDAFKAEYDVTPSRYIAEMTSNDSKKEE